MSICSVVVYTRPDVTEKVAGQIGENRICDVVAAESGRIIVVIDTHDRQVMSDTIMSFHDIEGVITVTLVYEYTEPGDVIGNVRVDAAREDATCVAGEGCGCEG